MADELTAPRIAGTETGQGAPKSRRRTLDTSVGSNATLPAQKKASKRTTDALRITKAQAGNVSVEIENEIISTTPDIEAIRKMFNNLDKTRVLGSFIAAPVVDLLAGFIGRPRVQPNGEGMEDVAATLDETVERNMAAITQVHRAALRDGRAYLLLSFELPGGGLYAADETGLINARVILRDNIRVSRNVTTGWIDYAAMRETIDWIDTAGNMVSAQIQTVFTPNTIERMFVGNTVKEFPESIKLGEETNRWGFVPIVEFVNEPETYGSEGVSEVERLEPLIKLYHEVLYAAAKGSKLHSTPKLALFLENKAAFLAANFPAELEAMKQGGAKPRINLSGRELLILGEGDKAAYVEASNPIGAAVELLKLIFYCMIITSETPEYALGVHMNSSYASTAEQTPVWVLKVQRKRAQFASVWYAAGRMMLAMLSKTQGRKLPSYAVTVNWIETDMRDKEATAKAQFDTVNAVLSAVDGLLMSDRAAIDTLRAVFPAMATYDAEAGGKSEIAEIKRTAIERQALLNEGAPASNQLIDVDAALKNAEALLTGGKV